MSKRANPTLVGAFVVGGITLLAAAAMFFGGAELFAPKARYVAYFTESVKGLRVGSNVLSGGVRVGEVVDINLRADTDSLETVVEVVLQVYPDAYRLVQNGESLGREANLMDREQTRSAVESGLRAQLDVESLVTGQLVVELDFFPDSPVVYRGVDPPYPEIPTIPSGLEQLLGGLRSFAERLQAEFDIEAFLHDVQGIAANVQSVTSSEDLRQSLAGLNELVNAPETQGLTARLDAAIVEFQGVLRDTRDVVGDVDRELTPFLARLGPAVDEFEATLTDARDALSAAARQAEGDTELVYELSRSLHELQRSLRSLRVFLDTVERHPESFLRGKPQ